MSNARNLSGLLDSNGDVIAGALDNAPAPNNATLAKAWVNFNGQSTVTVRDSYNTSSITDNGTGTYAVNFATSFANANYASMGAASRSATELLGGIQLYTSSGTATTSSCSVNTYSYGASNHDFPYVGVLCFGDQ